MNFTRAGLIKGTGYWATGQVARHKHEILNYSLVSELDPKAVTAKHNTTRWPVIRTGLHGSFTNKKPTLPTLNPTSRFVGGISRTRHFNVTSEPRSPVSVGGGHPIHRAKNPFLSSGQGSEGVGAEQRQWSPRASGSVETMPSRRMGRDIEEAVSD